MNRQPVAAIVSEFEGAKLGDKRREARLREIARSLAAYPDVSFPKAFRNEAALEAFYRFVRNPNVTFEKTIAPHIESSWKRVAQHDSVLVVHDTSALSFGDARNGRREGLGRINQADQGMLMHASLAISDATGRDPLGILSVRTWTRGDESRRAVRRSGEYAKAVSMAREQIRWNEHINAIEERSGGGTVVHLLDSEGDDYSILANLHDRSGRFVIRANVDRRLGGDEGHLRERIASVSAQCCYTIEVSKRGRPIGGTNPERRGRNVARDRRQARVEACSTRVTLMCPKQLRDCPLKKLDVNVVHVRETDVPEGETPVDWILYTSEAVDTADQLLRVVSMYRTRWLIEEFFKALKTGCAYEERQLESEFTLTNALAVLLPVAWGILRIRSLSQTDSTGPATRVLTPSQLAVLRIERPKLSDNPTVAEALLAIASMGGHIKNNGQPGWQTLLSGYVDLIKLDEFSQRLRQAKM